MPTELPPTSEKSTSHSFLTAAQVVGYMMATSAALAVLFGTAQSSWASGGTARVTPFVAAMVLGIGLGVVWHIALSRAADTKTSTGKLLVFLGGLKAAAIGLLTSGWLLAALIGGPLAKQQHAQNYAQHAEIALNIASGNANNEDNIPGYLKTASGNLRISAKREGDGLGPSKKVGEKTVWSEILSGVDALEKIYGNVTGQQASRDEFLKAARNDLQAMKIASGQFDDIGFADAATSFTGHISAASSIALTPSLSGILTGVFSAGQQGRSLLESTVRGLNEAAASVNKKRRDLAIPMFTPIDARMAVIEYGNWLVWGIAVSIELLPLLLLLMLLTLPRADEAREDQKPLNAPPSLGPMPSRNSVRRASGSANRRIRKFTPQPVREAAE